MGDMPDPVAMPDERWEASRALYLRWQDVASQYKSHLAELLSQQADLAKQMAAALAPCETSDGVSARAKKLDDGRAIFIAHRDAETAVQAYRRITKPLVIRAQQEFAASMSDPVVDPQVSLPLEPKPIVQSKPWPWQESKPNVADKKTWPTDAERLAVWLVAERARVAVPVDDKMLPGFARTRVSHSHVRVQLDSSTKNCGLDIKNVVALATTLTPTTQDTDNERPKNNKSTRKTKPRSARKKSTSTRARSAPGTST